MSFLQFGKHVGVGTPTWIGHPKIAGLGAALLLAKALFGCASLQAAGATPTWSMSTEVGNKSVKRTSLTELRARADVHQPRAILISAGAEVIRRRLVVEADYVCTPSGFGRTSTCTPRTGGL